MNEFWEDYKKSLKYYKNRSFYIIKDLYGDRPENYNIMIHKLNECKNVLEVDELLKWGRKNLL